MGYLLDLLLIGIIAVTALISARRGFVRTVLEVVGFIAAVLIASSFSMPLSNATYGSLIEKPVVSAVSSSTDATVEEIADKAWEALPGFITDHAEKFGISYESLTQKLSENAANGAESAAQAASDTIVKPIVTELLRGLYFVLLFIVLAFVAKFLAKLINRLFSFSLVGSLNRALGGILGAVKGLIYAFLICAFIMLIATLNGGKLWFINSETVSNSILFRLLAGLTPFHIT